jgi:hypothetical protein
VNQKVPCISTSANQLKVRADANNPKDIGAAESILAALLDSQLDNAPYKDGVDGAGLYSVDEILN